MYPTRAGADGDAEAYTHLGALGVNTATAPTATALHWIIPRIKAMTYYQIPIVELPVCQMDMESLDTLSHVFCEGKPFTRFLASLPKIKTSEGVFRGGGRVGVLLMWFISQEDLHL